MPLTELNHYVLVAKNLERTKNFYCEVLGLELADHPDFGFGSASAVTLDAGAGKRTSVRKQN